MQWERANESKITRKWEIDKDKQLRGQNPTKRRKNTFCKISLGRHQNKQNKQIVKWELNKMLDRISITEEEES